MPARERAVELRGSARSAMPCSSSAQCRCPLWPRGLTVFIAEDGKGPYPDVAW